MESKDGLARKQDMEWLAALRRSDRKAYAALFRHYYPSLCAYCQRFVALEDAEEIVQDALFWLWETREELAVQQALGAYLFKTVYHKAMNQIAQNEVKGRADTIFFEEMQAVLPDVDAYQFEELKERLREALAGLPESYREAFVLHRFRHMSYKEIAEKLGVSSKTVDYRIQQSLKILRIKLKDYLPLLFFLFYAR